MKDRYRLREAKDSDREQIWKIIEQAKHQMAKEKRKQWDASYPTSEHISADVANGYGYVMRDGDRVIAYAAIVFDGEPTYSCIEGKWLSELPYVVVHRLAVANEMKNRGIATIFLEKIEELSVKRGVQSFKVDTNFDNLGMQKVLEKCGFIYCGNIMFQGDSRRAYEKLIS